MKVHYEVSKWSLWPPELVDVWPLCTPERSIDKRYDMTIDWVKVTCKLCLAKKGKSK
jgi:hypothetical protein